MITYQVESVQSVQPEMEGLIEKHYEELEHFSDKLELSVDWNKYFELERLGVLVLFTARDGEKLVGYLVYMIMPGMHCSNDDFAINHTIYLSPDYRGSGLGTQLILFAEKCLSELDVSVITLHVKPAFPFDPLCEKLGYVQTERVYSKYIGNK